MSQELRQCNIDQALDRIVDKNPGALAVGDVHGFNVRQYLDNLRQYGPHRPVALSHLVRHPVTFFERWMHQRMVNFENYPEERRGIDAGAQRVHAQLKLEQLAPYESASTRLKAFLFSIRRLHRYAHNVWLTRKIHTIQFERMMTSPAYYRDCATYLTQGCVTPDAGYLDDVFAESSLENTGRIVGTSTTFRIAPQEQFEQWSDLEQLVFMAFFRAHEMANKFAHCEYDFSFLPRTEGAHTVESELQAVARACSV